MSWSQQYQKNFGIIHIEDGENMKKELVLEELRAKVPELSPHINEVVESSGGKENYHVILGDLINPYLENLLEENLTDYNRGKLVNLFIYLEELAKVDQYFKNVVQTSILETVLGKEQWKEKAVVLMNPPLKNILDEAEKHF